MECISTLLHKWRNGCGSLVVAPVVPREFVPGGPQVCRDVMPWWGVQPPLSSYNLALRSCAKARNWELALEVSAPLQYTFPVCPLQYHFCATVQYTSVWYCAPLGGPWIFAWAASDTPSKQCGMHTVHPAL